MTDEPSTKVTLEELLKLKRCERPTPEFWDGFDKSLQAKQLQALVSEPSAWQKWLRSSLRWSAIVLPMGAAAVAVFSLMPTTVHSDLAPEQNIVQDDSQNNSGLNQLAPTSLMPAGSDNWQFAENQPASQRFVMDTLSTAPIQRSHFRAVMHSTEMRPANSQSAVYVVNPIVRSDAAPAFASTALQRNF